MKETKIQKVTVRTPRQERAQYKIELILEAALRLLGKGGLAALTTNAVAETAGVSIGTLYQYFANKEAILDALAEREVAHLSERVLAAMQDPAALSPAQRVAGIVRAVTASYGGRPQVHRLVMEHSFTRGGSRRIGPMIERLVAFLTANGSRAGDGSPRPVSHADAFVLTNAFVGVMRAMIFWQDASAPPLDQIEASLARLVVGFVGDLPRGSQPE